MEFDLTTGSGNGPAPAGGDLIKDTTTQDFMADVIEASKTTPVLVDFWAEWCGPCKQLTPVLEKVVTSAGGAVKLVKMNIDEHPQIPGQLGVQSIPAVFAFKNGQPVDAFQGAVPESQVKQFIERLAGPVGPSPAEEMLAHGDEAFEAGDYQTAGGAYAAVLQAEAENAHAIGGLAKCLVETGELDRAREVLAMVPEEETDNTHVASARAALELAEGAADLGDIGELARQLETDPNNHQARFDLAVALNARGDREDAIHHLVEIVRRERAWNDEAARTQLVQFFDAWGPTDPMTIAGRRALSSVLFS